MADPNSTPKSNPDSSKLSEDIKLLKEENALLHKRINLQEEGYSLSSSYLESLKEVLGVKTKLTAFENDIYGISKQINKSLLSQKGEYDDIKDLTKQIKSNKDLIAKSTILERNLSKISNEEKVKAAAKELNNINNFYHQRQELIQGLQEENDLEQFQLDLIQQSIKELNEKINTSEENFNILNKSLSVEEQQLLYLQLQTKELKKQNEEREKEEKYLEDLNRRMGVIGATMAGISKIPIIGNLPGISTAFEKVKTQIKELEKAENRIVGKTEAMGMAFKNIGSSIKENLLDPTVLVSAAVGLIVKGFASLNQAQTDFGRETGRTASRWDATSTSVTTLSDYIKTATDLTKQLGFQADLIFTSKTLQEATEMVELMGMSSEEAGKLAMLSKLNGTELKKANESVIKTAGNFNKTNRTAISQKQILSDVANTSNVIAVNLGGNASKIAQANLEARKFGLSLEKADQIASSLLDFESSISSEIEAELLTGKDLNLEKARLLALNNDMAGLTKEIGQNQDIINAYTSGNRLQQEAIAKSVGLQREDIAKMIIDQKSQLGLTDEQVQKASGMNEEDFKRLSVQESINKSISKMGEALAGPLEMLASMAEHTGLMKVLFTGLATVITGVLLGGLVKSTLQLGTMLGLNLANAAAATATAEATTVGLATPAIIGGIALVMGAVMGAVGTAMAMKDGIIDPKKGPIVSGEFGTVQLNPNDQIVAGTDLAGTKKPKGGGSQPSIDITPMVQELQAVKAVLNQILAKESIVKMDSSKVGQAHQVGTVRVQ